MLRYDSVHADCTRALARLLYSGISIGYVGVYAPLPRFIRCSNYLWQKEDNKNKLLSRCRDSNPRSSANWDVGVAS